MAVLTDAFSDPEAREWINTGRGNGFLIDALADDSGAYFQRQIRDFYGLKANGHPSLFRRQRIRCSSVEDIKQVVPPGLLAVATAASSRDFDSKLLLYDPVRAALSFGDGSLFNPNRYVVGEFVSGVGAFASLIGMLYDFKASPEPGSIAMLSLIGLLVSTVYGSKMHKDSIDRQRELAPVLEEYSAFARAARVADAHVGAYKAFGPYRG